MAYRIGENLSVSQVFRDLYDFLTQMVTVYDIRYDTKGDGYLKDLSFYSDKAETETWTLKYKEEDSDGNAVFTVSGSISGDQDDIHATVAYDNGIFKTTLTNGDTEWQDGDIITLKTKEVTDPQWQVMTKYEKFGYVKTKLGHIMRPKDTDKTALYLVDDKKYEDKLTSAISMTNTYNKEFCYIKDSDETDNVGSKKFSITVWGKNIWYDRASYDYSARGVLAKLSSDNRTIYCEFNPNFVYLGFLEDNKDYWYVDICNYWSIENDDDSDGGKKDDDYVRISDTTHYAVGQKVITEKTLQKLEIKSIDRDNRKITFTTSLEKDMVNGERLYMYTTYDPTKFNLFTITFDSVTKEIIYYINKNAVWRYLLNDNFEENQYLLNGFGSQVGQYTDLVQWGKVLTLDEIRDLVDSNTSVDITSDDILEAPILDRETTIMGWVLKSSHSSLATDLFIQCHPYPYPKDNRQTSATFLAGYKFTQPIYEKQNQENKNFDPSAQYGGSPYFLDGGDDSLQWRDFGRRGGVVSSSHAVDTSENRHLGLLLRDPEKRISKYWFISDGKVLIVCLKIFDDVNTDKKIPVYQTVYVGDVDVSGSMGYTYVTASTHNGQDYWFNTDDMFGLSKSLYYDYDIGGIMIYSPNNMADYMNSLYRNDNDAYYRNNEEVDSGNYSIYPVYLEYRPYHRSYSYSYPHFIRFFYLNWAATQDLKPEDIIYVDGHQCVVVADGNVTDRLLLLNLDAKEG